MLMMEEFKVVTNFNEPSQMVDVANVTDFSDATKTSQLSESSPAEAPLIMIKSSPEWKSVQLEVIEGFVL